MLPRIEKLADIDDDEQPLVRAVYRERVAAPISIRWHSHGRGQALLVSTGLLTVQTEFGSWVVPTGHSLWLPSDQNHALRLYGNFSGYFVYVERRACAVLPARLGTAATSPLLEAAVARASAWSAAPAAGSPEERVVAVVLDEIAALPMQREYLPMPAHPGLLRIARDLIANPAENGSLETLAGDIGLSRRTVTRRFVQETGLTFSSWKQRVRLLQAMEMLANGQPVTTIALDLGYDSPSAFTVMFRKHFGVTPSRFVQTHAGLAQ